MVMKYLMMNVIYANYNVVLIVKHVLLKIIVFNAKKVMNYLILIAMNIIILIVKLKIVNFVKIMNV